MSFEIIVIAMEREVERRLHITKMLNSLGVHDFHFLNATDGKDKKSLEDVTGYVESKAVEIYGRPLTPSEIACFDSHRRSWEQIVISNRPTLILESDAFITKETLDLCKEVLLERGGKLPLWEHIMLYAHECLPSFWEKYPLSYQRGLVRFANKHAYVICTMLLTPEAAKKMLHHGEEIYLPVDNYMTGGKVNKGINLYAIYPPAANLSKHSENSTIQAEREKYKRKSKKSFSRYSLPLRNVIRQLKKPNKWL